MGLIELAVFVFLFACAVFGLYWVLDRSKAPQFAYWICGFIVVVILLVFLVQASGLSGENPLRFHMNR